MTSASKSQAQAPPGADEQGLRRDAARSRIMIRLASTLRHDLNSPLQAAIWAFDLIERGLATHPDVEQRAKIATSVELGRRELTRLQTAVRLFVACAAPLDDRAENFDLRDVLGEIERLVTAEATLRDVHLVFKEQSEPLAVSGIRHQVQQALLLLALEALDAAAAGGDIKVEPAMRDDKVEVNVSHTVNGTHKAASADAELSNEVVDAVAAAHGGQVLRRDAAGRRDMTFTLTRR